MIMFGQQDFYIVLNKIYSIACIASTFLLSKPHDHHTENDRFFILQN